MRVWVVLAYDQYYPCGDNIKGIFDREDSAGSLADKLLSSQNYDYVDVTVKEVQK